MSVFLGLLNYGLLLFFGVILTIDFSGIKKTHQNRQPVFLFLFLIAVVQLMSWYFFGLSTTTKLYPLITHLPLVIFVSSYFKRPWLVAWTSVLTAYLCCQTPRWFGTIALYLFGTKTAYFLGDIITLFPMFYLLRTYIAPAVNQLMNHSKRSLLLFASVPFMYYLFDYTTTVYTDLLYTGASVAIEFMPSLVSMFYFIFIMIYYSELEKRNKMENDYLLLSMQANQSQKELTSLYKLQEQTICYRHDLRHHLSLISSMLSNDEIEKTKNYLAQVEQDINAITPIRFCQNETVNLILLSFASKAKQLEILLEVDVDLPFTLAFSDTDLCAILSNGLENAIVATHATTFKNKTVHINCKLHKGKLLIFITNPYEGKIEFQNEIPIAKQQGHGFGVKSLLSIAAKYDGYCSFEVVDAIFTLRMVLPLSLSDVN